MLHAVRRSSSIGLGVRRPAFSRAAAVPPKQQGDCTRRLLATESKPRSQALRCSCSRLHPGRSILVSCRRQTSTPTMAGKRGLDRSPISKHAVVRVIMRTSETAGVNAQPEPLTKFNKSSVEGSTNLFILHDDTLVSSRHRSLSSLGRCRGLATFATCAKTAKDLEKTAMDARTCSMAASCSGRAAACSHFVGVFGRGSSSHRQRPTAASHLLLEASTSRETVRHCTLHILLLLHRGERT